jgi:hypothetical protein
MGIVRLLLSCGATNDVQHGSINPPIVNNSCGY